MAASLQRCRPLLSQLQTAGCRRAFSISAWEVAELERMSSEAEPLPYGASGLRRVEVQGRRRNIEEAFEKAAAKKGSMQLQEAAKRRAELQAQILQQKEMTEKQSEILAQSLAEAASDRALLQEKVVKLSKDLHILTAQMLKEQVGIRARIQRTDVRGRGGQSRLAYRPTVEDAERQPTHVCEMSHQTLAELAMLENHNAHRERLLREVMAVDGVSWGQAHESLNKFDEYNERYYWLESFPYRMGIVMAFFGGIGGTLMVFYKPVALFYGEQVAGEELPEGVKDISELTTNQVGTWTWGWMEPMLGVASFCLLCCQFSRTQVKKMNMKTYGRHILQWRADRLAKQYPEYDRSMVRAWAKHLPSVNLGFFPVYEKNAGFKGPTSGL